MILKNDQLVFRVQSGAFNQAFTSFAAAAGTASALTEPCDLTVTAYGGRSSWTATLFRYEHGTRKVISSFAVNQVIKHIQGF